jgi:hypothetical protein
MTKDVTKKHTQEVATTDAEDKALSFGANIGMEDVVLPRIEMIQAMSPSAQTGQHKPGTLVNNITKETLAEPVTIVPVFMFSHAIKWRPRTEGGGMIYKTTDFKDPQVAKDLQWDGDNKPVADRYINIVCKVVGQDMPLVASFTKTSLTAGQNLITMIAFDKTAWNHKYILHPVLKTFKQGQAYVFSVVRGETTTPDEQIAAKELAKQMKSMRNIETIYEGDTTAEETPATSAEPREF